MYSAKLFSPPQSNLLITSFTLPVPSEYHVIGVKFSSYSYVPVANQKWLLQSNELRNLTGLTPVILDKAAPIVSSPMQPFGHSW